MLASKIKAALALAAVALVFSSGWWVRDLQADAAEAARLKAEDKGRVLMRELADTINQDTAKAIGSIRVENRTIHQKAIHEIQRDTIYADCRVPADGVRLLNDARAAANARIPALPAAPGVPK